MTIDRRDFIKASAATAVLFILPKSWAPKIKELEEGPWTTHVDVVPWRGSAIQFSYYRDARVKGENWEHFEYIELVDPQEMCRVLNVKSVMPLRANHGILLNWAKRNLEPRVNAAWERAKKELLKP